MKANVRPSTIRNLKTVQSAIKCPTYKRLNTSKVTLQNSQPRRKFKTYRQTQNGVFVIKWQTLRIKTWNEWIKLKRDSHTLWHTIYQNQIYRHEPTKLAEISSSGRMTFFSKIWSEILIHTCFKVDGWICIMITFS